MAFVWAKFSETERTTCKLLGVDRSSYRYEPRSDRNAELCEELVKLARQRPRFGYRREQSMDGKPVQVEARVEVPFPRN